jgi:hypothetical protein
MKTVNEKGLEKLFDCFWFLDHSLMWFLVVPPKDGFTQQTKFLRPLAHFMKNNPTSKFHKIPKSTRLPSLGHEGDSFICLVLQNSQKCYTQPTSST